LAQVSANPAADQVTRRYEIMNISTEDVAGAVIVNFRRLSPDERRQVLQKLITDLDAPQQIEDSGGNKSKTEPETDVVSGGLLGWLGERLTPAEMAEVLRQYLPDFSPDSLKDPQQRALADRRLSGLSPFVLYELHKNFIGRAKKDRRLTPGEIVERTWGTIRETDEEVLREIIEDEEYCGY
jgi:hypothetical protein